LKNLNHNQIKIAEIVKNTPGKELANGGAPPDIFDREAKLLSHLDRIVEWRETGTTFPIYIGLDPTSKCNHRCPDCVGLMGQDLSTIPTQKIDEILGEMAGLGLKAVSLGVAGDPSCHPDLAGILHSIGKHKLEAGYYSNGELLRERDVEATVKNCSWVRFSLDADGPEIHQLIHGGSALAFARVVKNMRRLQEERTKNNSPIVLGAGYLVRPDTTKGIYNAASLCRDLGWDYIRIRPFFGYDNNPLCNEEEVAEILSELERCMKLETKKFKVSVPKNRIDWVRTGNSKINYKRCNVHHFSTIISGDMKVYLCCHTVGWEKYCLGDLNKDSFADIWYSDTRKKIFENIDYRDCATPCSMSVFNELLNKFEAETVHTNFL
jgi:cyclic pyranopterin phosphate synthase